jgi:hypothetical protein
MNISLIGDVAKQDINTSLIAIRNAINELNNSSNKSNADIQKQINLINKQIKEFNIKFGDIDIHLDAIDSDITDLQPVDTVASGNLHSVTSNAVAQSIVVKKDIAYSYTGSPSNLEEIIKQIVENRLNYITTDTNIYAGAIISTHSGGGDFGSWLGTYLIRVQKNNVYGTHGIVSAQGYLFNINLNNGVINVKKTAMV